MNNSSCRIIELVEYVPMLLPRQDLPNEVGELLWNKYKNQIHVEFPSIKTDHQWQLTSQGWAGFIPVVEGLGIALRPKVTVANIFGMLEYAYQLKSFRFIEGLFQCKSLEEFYERLAHVLASRILQRGRKGFYRDYIPLSEKLPYLCGRLNVRDRIRKPWEVALDCSYHEHTADLDENQILAWTLYNIVRSGLCTERVLPTARRAYRELQSIVSLKPFCGTDCIQRLYNRLNEDYQPLHTLCRFFLEHSGPALDTGDRTMLPFLVNMERLYELFVSEWLRKHLPAEYYLHYQEQVDISADGFVHFDIDLVVYSSDSGQPICVLDTKYKTPEALDAGDVAKVHAYASSKGCKTAFLIYPNSPSRGRESRFGDVHVGCLTFSLENDLEDAGQAFLTELLGSCK